MAITIAWGALETVGIGERMAVQGRRFQLLPGDTMFKASGMLHGMMGLPLRQLSATKFEVLGSAFVLVGLAGTPRVSLMPFDEQILASYRLAQLQFGAGAPAGE
jgi:hypothetical protein